jgi:hypothetical protein
MKKHLAIILVASLYACNSPKPDVADSVATPKQFEFGDEKYSDIALKSLTELAAGNIEGFIAEYSENSVFSWSSGDSLTTKAAIVAYWKDRRANLIDTIIFEKGTWLSIKSNEAPPAVGNWALNWSNFNVRYQNGKTVTMSIHHVFHFDNSDKIDRVVQFVDRAPIAAALASN